MNEEQLEAEIERLNAHCKRMASDLVDIADDHSRLFHENARLKTEVERLTKAVMHSPAAQLKLKELEGKTTFDEINPKDDNSNITTELLVLCNRQASDIRRLTKAGDAMADYIMVVPGTPMAHVYLIDWNAAKEGKQP
jgi:regulator of replication initiation timing